MTRLFALLLLLISPGFLTGCATETRKKPRGPQSEESAMPWNRPLPGEGQGMFGGALERR